jgi:hypothetical protein
LWSGWLRVHSKGVGVGHARIQRRSRRRRRRRRRRRSRRRRRRSQRRQHCGPALAADLGLRRQCGRAERWHEGAGLLLPVHSGHLNR